jgi:hypothetical protein
MLEYLFSIPLSRLTLENRTTMQADVDKRSISGEKYALTRSTRRIPRALGSVTAAKNEVLANQLLLL